MVRVRVLGALEATVHVDGRDVVADLGGPRQRAVLALLLVGRGEVVSVDRLVEDLWNSEPPPRAIGALQAYVSHLRRALEPGRQPRTPATVLVSEPPGYAVRLPVDAVDAWRFEAMVRSRRRHRRPGGNQVHAGAGARTVARARLRARPPGNRGPSPKRPGWRACGWWPASGGVQRCCAPARPPTRSRRRDADPRASVARGRLAVADARVVRQRAAVRRPRRAAEGPRDPRRGNGFGSRAGAGAAGVGCAQSAVDDRAGAAASAAGRVVPARPAGRFRGVPTRSRAPWRPPRTRLRATG